MQLYTRGQRGTSMCMDSKAALLVMNLGVQRGENEQRVSTARVQSRRGGMSIQPESGDRSARICTEQSGAMWC